MNYSLQYQADQTDLIWSAFSLSSRTLSIHFVLASHAEQVLGRFATGPDVFPVQGDVNANVLFCSFYHRH